MDIGARIRDARLAAGLTQVELAERAGVHEITIVRIETGQQQATVATLTALAAALGVSVADWLSAA